MVECVRASESEDDMDSLYLRLDEPWATPRLSACSECLRPEEYRAGTSTDPVGPLTGLWRLYIGSDLVSPREDLDRPLRSEFVARVLSVGMWS